MYTLEEIREFAYFWEANQLSRLVSGDESWQVQGADEVAHSCWRWTAPALLQQLPISRPLIADHLLYALAGIDPRWGVRAAVEMLEAEECYAILAGSFLANLPPRMVQGVTIPALPHRSLADAPFDEIEPMPCVGDAHDRVLAPGVLRKLQEAARRSWRDLVQCPWALWPSGVVASLRTLQIVGADELRLLVEETIGKCRIDLCKEAVLGFGFATGVCEPGIALARLTSDSYHQQCWVVRTLARWFPDEALKLFDAWVVSSTSDNRNLAADILFEVIAVELGWPCKESADRLERCRDLSLKLLNDSHGNIRVSALANLAGIQWPGWQRRAQAMLSDRDVMARCEALGLFDDRDMPLEVPVMQSLLADSDRSVRQRAFLMLRRTTPAWSGLEPVLQPSSEASNPAVRIDLLGWLAKLARPEGVAIAKRLFKDRDGNVRIAALRTLEVLDRLAARICALRGLKDKKSAVVKQALEALAPCGEPNDLAAILPAFSHADDNVCLAAIRTAVRLAPDRTIEVYAGQLRSRHTCVANFAAGALKAVLPLLEFTELLWESLPKVRGGSGGAIFQQLVEVAPERLDEAIAMAIRSRSPSAREFAVKQLAKRCRPEDIAQLKIMLGDPDGSVRYEALTNLRKQIRYRQIKPLAIARLEDPWRPALAEALQILSVDSDPGLLEVLLPLARHAEWQIRLPSLRVLRKFDDPRVLAELISSLNDIDGQVRYIAHRVLMKKLGPVPSLDRLQVDGAVPPWQQIQDRVAAINRWASQIGRELLGRPVKVENYRQGLGRTPHARKHGVRIEVSDTPVTHGHPHGEEIMRAIALHEIGHHLYDVGIRGNNTVRGVARSEGVGEIYDILRDERLERALRSRRPEWGPYFDRLASYAFSQNVNLIAFDKYAAFLGRTPAEVIDAMNKGELPGKIVAPRAGSTVSRVALRDIELLAVPGAVPPLMAFLACLRCGFDPGRHPDPRVAAAIALVPDNLKDLDHAAVLEVARQIGRVIDPGKEFHNDLRRLRQQIRLQPVLAPLAGALDRIGETNQIPGLAQGAAGIRTTPDYDKKGPPPPPMRELPGRLLNLGEGTNFPELENEFTLAFDPAAHAQLVAPLRRHIRLLRDYLQRLGVRDVDEHASRRGRRLDLTRLRSAVLCRNPNLLVNVRQVIAPDAYLGLLIDRSGSMSGEKLERAKAFGALLAESAKGLPGIAGHVSAFDGRQFIELGGFQRNAIASLTAEDGNNDSGALARAARLAQASGRKHKLLIMISDGSPSQCTFESLKQLVERLTSVHGMVCVQVAVDAIADIAFRNYVDLSQFSFDEAVTRFGRLLIRLTQAWR